MCVSAVCRESASSGRGQGTCGPGTSEGSVASSQRKGGPRHHASPPGTHGQGCPGAGLCPGLPRAWPWRPPRATRAGRGADGAVSCRPRGPPAGGVGAAGSGVCWGNKLGPQSPPPPEFHGSLQLASVWPGLCHMTLSAQEGGQVVLTAGRRACDGRKTENRQVAALPSSSDRRQCPGDVEPVEGRSLGQSGAILPFNPIPIVQTPLGGGPRRAVLCAPHPGLCPPRPPAPGQDWPGAGRACAQRPRHHPLSCFAAFVLELPPAGSQPRAPATRLAVLGLLVSPLGLSGLLGNAGSGLLLARPSGLSDSGSKEP